MWSLVMASDSISSAKVAEALESLRQEIARLGARVSALESTAQPPSMPESTELDDELVMILSAAVAAYLGVKPHIRQIRLIGGSSWAQQGRATIQASHALPFKHN
jgi:methylmalonyl-CoA carboxyltransferase large subunit